MVSLLCLQVMVFDVAWKYRSWRQSDEVLQRNQVAECYVNPYTCQYFSIREYGDFCFLKELTEKRTFTDKIILTLYFGLKQWVRIALFVHSRMHVHVNRYLWVFEPNT